MPYDPNKPIIIATDASPYGTAAVLYHLDDNNKERPVFFTSRTLNSSQRKYPQHEKESLALIHAVTKFHKYLFGKRFIIYTDNKPIVSLLSQDKSVPTLAKMRLQRWAVILGAYNYELKYRKGTDLFFPDFLSRKPLSDEDLDDTLINLIDQFRTCHIPIDIKTMALETQKDKALNEVYNRIMMGWPQYCPNDYVKPYFLKKEHLSVEKDCVMLGERVVVPPSLKKDVLNLLHLGHPGLVKSKLLARTLIWWPNVDQDLELYLKNCEICQAVRNSEPNTLLSWPESTRRLQRVHLDFAVFKQKYYLVIVDSFSNWIDVIPVTSIDFSTIELALLKFFSDNGLSEILVTDGGPPFSSQKFSEFCLIRGIKHIFSAPYHAQSNGPAERAVQTFKVIAKKIHVENPQISNVNFQKKILEYLSAFRNTPNATKGKSPAELFLKSKCKTRLTNLNPLYSQEKIPSKPPSQPQNVKRFDEGQIVYVRVPNNDLIKWQKGQIVKKISECIYSVKVNDKYKNCHIDHLRMSGVSKQGDNLIDSEDTAQLSFPTPRRVPQTPPNAVVPVHNNAPLSPHGPVPPIPVTPINPIQPNITLQQGQRKSTRVILKPKRLDL
jgi:hypothetical protein